MAGPVPGEALAPTEAPTAAPTAAPTPPPAIAEPLRQADLALAKELFKRKGTLILDARSRMEYDQKHIKGALSLPARQYEAAYAEHHKKLAKAKAILCYCGQGCGLAAFVGNRLINQGHKNVHYFHGGWDQWVAAGLPTAGAGGGK